MAVYASAVSAISKGMHSKFELDLYVIKGTVAVGESAALAIKGNTFVVSNWVSP